MRKILAVILMSVTISASLSGCFHNVREAVVVTEKAPHALCEGVPRADILTMRRVEFFIVEDEHGIKWIALTPKNYENLSLNTKEILKHLEQKKKIIEFYEKCIADVKQEKTPNK